MKLIAQEGVRKDFDSYFILKAFAEQVENGKGFHTIGTTNPELGPFVVLIATPKDAKKFKAAQKLSRKWVGKKRWFKLFG